MPVPTDISELSTTAASNYPAGSDSPAVLDDVQRAHAAFIAQLRDSAHTGDVTGGAVATVVGINGVLLSGLATGLLKNTTTTGVPSIATANTDYLAPALANTAVTGFKTATFNGQGASATTSGAVTIDWTAAQNYLQTEPTGAITYTFTAPPGPCHLQLIINSDGTSTAQTITWPASVIQYNSTWAGANNKKSIINFWYDGTSYHMMAGNQV